MHPFFSWVLESYLQSFWTLSQVNCLSPHHWLFWGSILFLHLEHIPLLAHFLNSCLKFYLYFYVCGSLGMFLNLGEVSLFRGCSLCHQMVRDQLWSQSRFWPVCRLSSTDNGTVISYFWFLTPGGWVWFRGLCRVSVGGVGDFSLVDGVGSGGQGHMSRGMSWGDCGLRKSLGSCLMGATVLTLFSVCPEWSPYWSLQLIGWGQVLVLMSLATHQASQKPSNDWQRHAKIFLAPLFISISS